MRGRQDAARVYHVLETEGNAVHWTTTASCRDFGFGRARLLPGKLRMRQVVAAPDGALLILTDEERGQVLRLAPG